MTILLLCIFMVVEIAFCVRDFRLNLMKKEWSLHRFSVNGLELGIYLVMMILPGIDLASDLMISGLAIMTLSSEGFYPHIRKLYPKTLHNHY